ncbi:hypothetical protein [Clostridium saccharobutylicum]|uniref:Uncharacterized protein n=1 Tax=Clostridium saccharobutylicum DSM 13864 TaxID=1345695 RepID=U5MYD9_CLOSA|nr:hypothetical protein [Clostridium saccharobutylicum]AGX44477.1 hypothetical protein CLSA_c35160 [Clostridium saccharobutylicum DSM 13864]AQR91772.1 hypothetical protein CLOSC_35000 [Clostridium saccharobutylicum]AQS01674.1 hypothetical protein CSACC_35050 [Clostridium saccharobutylicum]AQS15657.1 hypothetical protein CLOSACC_35050 [Clostridium saccharobutylicum]MBA2907433.1 hypothetical protein [Clostridium saccharobutylicum]
MIYEQIKEILSRREKLHSEDDNGIQKCWDELIELLSKDEDNTIECLNLCTNSEVDWLSEVFEDVAYNLQSRRYIECLKKLDIKYPELNLTRSITIAEDYLE